MKDLQIIILAAGAGTRMKSNIPKVLHKISGKPMLYFVIKEAKKISDKVTVVLYHKANLIKEEISKYFDDIEFVLQDHKNYPGTGGAIRGIEFIREKVLVLNGDMPLVIANELKVFAKITADIVMGVLKLDDASGYGRVIIEHEEVKRIVEQKDCQIEELAINTANSGVYLFKRDFLKEYLQELNNHNAQKEYYITDLVEIAVKNNFVIKPLFVNVENFKGVNTKYDLAHAQELHQKRLKQEIMNNGVIMMLPDTIYIEDGCEFIGECEIESGVVIKGKSKIINSKILANSVIEDAYIKNSQIGPMARIRPKSKIINSKIGNFVETKSAILDDVKAGHLSYLGDCEIGSGTNIGAGTITCNYDGKNKYKTIIGKNCFIGSDTKFIAPVTLKNNSMTASGSVISNDVEEGELAIERVKQKNIKGFYYKFFKV